ncbi:lyase family protein, partial [Solidesulfovibrio sp.]|uniref:lyase family protein n=1 Tax=Solidesulfovibrio sp. TaxID=2910990 RepID=UPI0026200D0B
ATPITLGQEIGGWVEQIDYALGAIELNLGGLYDLAIGGTAVGTGLNSHPQFGDECARIIAELTGYPFKSCANKFFALSAHDALINTSAAIRSLAMALMKIANDVRWLASGPRCGIGEIDIPENEPGSSIMPGKVNPTQCEALTMAAAQVMACDVAVGFGGAGGILEMNVYKPLMIHNIMKSIRILTNSMHNFRVFLVEGMEPNRKRIAEFVGRSLMLVTALSPVIGYDKASKIAHHAMDNDLTLREAALSLGYVDAAEYDRIVVPANMTTPFVAKD